MESPDGSYPVSDIQDCIEYIIKKHKTLKKIPPIYVYINRINNRLEFKIKDGYNLEYKCLKQWKYLAGFNIYHLPFGDRRGRILGRYIWNHLRKNLEATFENI